MAFSKKKVDDRKKWLSAYQQGTFLDQSVEQISYKDFVHKVCPNCLKHHALQGQVFLDAYIQPGCTRPTTCRRGSAHQCGGGSRTSVTAELPFHFLLHAVVKSTCCDCYCRS